MDLHNDMPVFAGVWLLPQDVKGFVAFLEKALGKLEMETYVWSEKLRERRCFLKDHKHFVSVIEKESDAFSDAVFEDNGLPVFYYRGDPVKWAERNGLHVIGTWTSPDAQQCYMVKTQGGIFTFLLLCEADRAHSS